MDRRSWLWRRKSSEKNGSGETESSGSLSSLSGRFSDEQILSNPNSQSPEVTSKAADDDGLHDGLPDNVKSLSEKLAEALASIRDKDDLVKQHAKVAEEAVSGWERSENEMMLLKKQVEALTKENSGLEERVGHLDGALKECLRQLRQAREEQEEKIYDALVEKSSEWESKKSQLEDQLVELQSQLQTAKSDSTNTMLHGVQSKLEVAEKENLTLKLKLQSVSEELELMICERDLSTRAAESASKQRLESLRKVSKLEAECRRLKAVAQKQTLMNDQLSVTASSVYAESVTDTMSDCGERMLLLESDIRKNRATNDRNFVGPTTEIDLMDDFLEIERLAACPKPQSERNDGTWTNQGQNGEMEAMMNRTAELEEKLKMMETEKVKLETALNECQIKLNTSEDRLEQTQTKLVKLSTELAQANEAKRATEKEVESMSVKLKNSARRLDEAESKTVKLQNELSNANEAKDKVEVELKNANVKKREAELKLKEMGLDLQITRSSIRTLEKAVDKEKTLSREAFAKCEKLDAEMSKMKLDSKVQRSAIVDEFRINQDKELEVAASKFAECQKTIASLGRQLKSLATFDDLLLSSERPVDEVV